MELDVYESYKNDPGQSYFTQILILDKSNVLKIYSKLALTSNEIFVIFKKKTYFDVQVLFTTEQITQ